MNELDKRMARGALWLVLVRAAVRSLGLVSTVVLARLLAPADFGLVAMATSIIVLLELATAFSFDISLIQNANVNRQHFDTAWTLNIALYSSLTLLLFVVATPAAAFYNEPRLERVIYALAVGFLFQGFENTGVVRFRKELNFSKDFVLMFSKKLIGFMVTIPLAFYLRNYWALVAGMAAGNALGVALTYMMHPFRPRFSLAEAGHMLGFSKWLLLNNSLTFLMTRSADFVVGRLAGPAGLGLFTIAYEIATLPTTELVAPINRVALPGYAKLAATPAALRDSYLNLLSVIGCCALPAGAGIAAVAPAFVALFLGDRWTAAVPIVQVLAVFGAVNSLTTNVSSLYNGLGKPRTISLLGAGYVAVLLSASIALGLAYGAPGVAAAYAGSALLMTPIIFAFVGRELGVGLGGIGAVLWRPLAASAAMYGFVRWLIRLLAAAGVEDAYVASLIAVPVGALSYVVFSAAFWQLAGRPATADVRLVAALLARVRSKLVSKPVA